MKLVELQIDGFGKLVDRRLAFDSRFNVVYGPNEAGKSTLSCALQAILYGFARGERESWRPWSGTRYGAALTYQLSDGRTFEVRRDFERDQKGIKVYDEHGNDASGECAVGKSVNPGYAHLGIPLEVFVNASFVAQGDVAIDGSRAERITHALSRALDGGPKEDAALGAMERLDAALALHVGKKRATVNAPLRHIHESIAEAERQAEAVRTQLRTLDDLRARLDAEKQRSKQLDAALREQERRGRSLRAYVLRSRLDSLRKIRDDVAAMQAERTSYDDVENFPSYLVAELEELYREAHTLEALARSHAEEAARARMTPAMLQELDERMADGGALDDAQFAELEAAAAAATKARNAATLAADKAQTARRAIGGGGELFGAVLTLGALFGLSAGAFAAFQHWAWATVLGALAIVFLAFAMTRWQRRRTAARTVETMQIAADSAVATERAAATLVAGVLEPLGATSLEELAKRRERARSLQARKTDALRLAERAHTTRAAADTAGRAFDDLVARLVTPTGARKEDLAAAKTRETRKSARDGIDLRLCMLDVQRNDVLGSDDEFALEDELGELIAAGVEPAPLEGISARLFEAERADIERRASDSRANVAALDAELRTAEAQIGDLAALDEQTLALRAQAERLERFEAAVELARETIGLRASEAHQKFARRLADYSSRTFAAVTAGRYADLRVDPTTLALRVRVPETGAIIDVDRLSAGTREQAYLVVRLAMVRMFSEGIETAPLLLDDPFAFWDEARIERSFPILEALSGDAQIILFTTSKELAAAAAARGARLIDLARETAEVS